MAANSLATSLLDAWRTTCNVTTFLVERIPPDLWAAKVPASRRTVRSIAGHLHNSRCRWIKTLGHEHGVRAPAFVDLHRVTPRQLVTALGPSGKGIESLLMIGLDAGGVVPPSKAYVWRNLPLDVGHVLAYFVAHEAHHRGQIVMLARQLDHRLPHEAGDGLWMWSRLRN